jgi:hypothetical protein
LGQEAAGVQIAETVYALDSATMDLLVGPRVRFRDTKAAVKLHTLLDLRGNFQTICASRTASSRDQCVRFARSRSAFYVIGRGFVDSQRVPKFDLVGTRAKSNRRFQAHRFAPGLVPRRQPDGRKTVSLAPKFRVSKALPRYDVKEKSR